MQLHWQFWVPHKLLAKIALFFADSQITWLKNILIFIFIHSYDIDMQEAIEVNPYAYPSFNSFFTRSLKSSARPLDEAKLIAPADGTVAQYGKIEDDTLLQAKGFKYNLFELMPDKDINCANYLTIYLAPYNYHKVHMPITGKLIKMQYIPGSLFSVNFNSTRKIPKIFARNERLICIFETNIGKVSIVMVGAMIVGGIETSWHGRVCPPHTKKIVTWEYDETIILEKGSELGKFVLGSTVILLSENFALDYTILQVGQKIKFGEQVAI